MERKEWKMAYQRRKTNGSGFTLIELMIVVAIIGVLAAIAMPKFAQLLEKSREGATKGSVAAIRSAIAIYYSEKEGTWPGDLTTSFTSYLYPVPNAKASPLGNTATVNCAATTPSAAGTGWCYITDSLAVYAGDVYANSIATDTKGISFSTY
jgi:prepilin-type N-terminal cleavage/methylation domain-containing protein